LYNIEEDEKLPEYFDSFAWSFDNAGPLKAKIRTKVVRSNRDGSLIKYKNSPTPTTEESIKAVLEYIRFLGISKDAYQCNTKEVYRLSKLMEKRIMMIAGSTESSQEATTVHNMLVNGLATYSPLCIPFFIDQATKIDSFCLKIYKRKFLCTNSDSKHYIFLSKEVGGHGLKSFTAEYTKAVMRELDGNLNQSDSLHSHALKASVQADKRLTLRELVTNEDIPDKSMLGFQAKSLPGCEIEVRHTQNDTQTQQREQSEAEFITDHENIAGNSIRLAASFGILLRDLNLELGARIVETFLQSQKGFIS